MFDHVNFAVDGLMPGFFNHASAAISGAFEVQVIIEPVIPASGGGYVPWTKASQVKPDRYRVTVVVTVNGKKYSDSQVVDDNQARVIAKFNGIDFDETTTMISVNGVQVFNEQAQVKITSFIIR